MAAAVSSLAVPVVLSWGVSAPMPRLAARTAPPRRRPSTTCWWNGSSLRSSCFISFHAAGGVSKRGTTHTSTAFCWDFGGPGRSGRGTSYLAVKWRLSPFRRRKWRLSPFLLRDHVESGREDHVQGQQLKALEPVA